MKIAIVGAGIAGGYLAKLLEQKGIVPDVYDPGEHGTGCGCRSCGWGAPVGIKPYLAEVDLDLDEYLIDYMFSMNFDGLVAKTPLCTVNKPRLVRDLSTGIRLNKRKLDPDEADAYDILVDATGISRALLPPCRSDLTLPTVQHRVAVESIGWDRLEAGVYGNRIPGLGYLWIFPLGNDQYHIGIGGIGLLNLDSLMDRFFRESSDRFSFRTLCRCTGEVRVASPYYSTPLYLSRDRKGKPPQLVIGVGESIGIVSPFTGEGIVYSLECARILAESWPDPEEYTRTVLARFAWMKKERETLDFLLEQGNNGGPRLRDRWRFYRNARRSGIELPLLEAFKRMGSLSRWIDVPD
jgi:flavin-dependent dehydrogenase